MDSAQWDPRLDSVYSFGRPYLEKPSFEGLRPETINAARASLLAADRAAAEWQQVEFLFERNWFGPCACLGGRWSSGTLDDVNSSDGDAADSAALADANPRPTAAAAASTAACLFRFFRPSGPQPPAAAKQQQRPVNQTLPPNGIAGQAPLYDAAVAPVPEPAFGNHTPQGASPQKTVPVPMRVVTSVKENGGDGPLPPTVAIEPTAAAATANAAAPLPAQATPPNDLATAVVGPQLGTWADRQYRLLDPVPERNEFGPGSNSGNSMPSSSAGNHRSPNTPVMLGRNGSGAGSGSGGCGSASGEYSVGGGGCSSGVHIASQAAAPASPTLLDLLNKQQLQQQQQQQLNHHRYDPQEHEPSVHGGACHPQDGRPPLPSGPAAANGVAAQGQGQQQQRSAAANGAEPRPIDPEALIQEAAWRWRFTRRWQAEQSRTDAASSAPKDQMEEALAYLQATNATTTVSMQIANTSGRCGGSRGGGGMSMEGSLMLTSGMVGTLGAAGSTLGGDWPLGACGSGSGSFTSGPRILGRQASGELLAASREVASLNRRAAVVLQQQMDCEIQAERRVQESLGAGPPWVGHLIPVVQIDEWGSFRFLMLKLRDQSARGGAAPGSERQRIVIRGHNYGSEGQLMEECNREILALAHKHGLPFEAPTCMGGGVMEWRRDRDRHLHLHSGFVMDRALPLMAGGGIVAPGGNGGRPASAMDLLNLAAALARQSFPPTYKITVLT